jgi:spermidine synthase
VIFYLLLIGFVSILGQVVILRELSVAFFGVELIYILALAIWLLGTAAGASFGRRSFIPSIPRVSLLLGIFNTLLIADFAFIRASRLIFGAVPGAYLPFFQQIFAMTIALMPVSFMLGLLFQWTARQYVSFKRTLAGAYAIESAGGLAGGLASTLLLKFGVQNFSIALLCVLISLGSLFFYKKKDRYPLSRFWLVGLSFLMLLMLWKSPEIDRWMTGWNHPNLVAVKDTPYSRIAISRLSGQISVFENDALAFESEGTAAEEFVHLAKLQRPGPKRVLVLGGGIEGIVYELTKHPLESIDYVELNRFLITLAQGFLPEKISRSLNADNVRVIFADPREFLENCGTYDLILVGMPEPASGQSNRFYTREFFRHCASRLSPEGILAFRLRSAENLWSPQLTQRNTSIYRALKAIFPEVLVLPGVTNIFFSSAGMLTRDPEILISRLTERPIETRMVTPAYIRYLYTNDRYREISDILSRGAAPINTDVRPICYQYTLAIWLSKFFPVLALVDLTAYPGQNPALLGGALLITIILLIVALHRITFRRVLLAAIAGFLGMVMETTLILYYQIHRGILYQDLRILLMAFMAGLALGAFVVDRRKRTAPGGVIISRYVGISLLISFLLMNIGLGWAFGAFYSAELWSITILLLFTGFLVAAVFAFASLYGVENQQAIISPLYAADLIGGGFGAVLASLMLIPVIGLAGSAYLMAILAGISLLLVYGGNNKGKI